MTYIHTHSRLYIYIYLSLECYISVAEFSSAFSKFTYLISMIPIISDITVLVSIAYHDAGPTIQNCRISNALHVPTLFNVLQRGKINN